MILWKHHTVKNINIMEINNVNIMDHWILQFNRYVGPIVHVKFVLPGEKCFLFDKQSVLSRFHFSCQCINIPLRCCAFRFHIYYQPKIEQKN